MNDIENYFSSIFLFFLRNVSNVQFNIYQNHCSHPMVDNIKELKYLSIIRQQAILDRMYATQA